MKYIMLTSDDGQHIPILFPDFMVHEDVAKAICRLMAQTSKTYITPTSAGFVSLGDVVTHGESESIGVKSTEIDAAYIEFGDAVSFMPEEMLRPLLGKLKAAK